MPSTPFALILPAAGRSARFGGPTNKLLAPLARSSVLARSLSAFLRRSDVCLAVLPTLLPPGGSTEPADVFPEAHPELIALLRDPRVRLCAGGSSRAASVRAALALVPPGVVWVAVHDAARPLVSNEVIDRALAAAVAHGAAVPALPTASTVKEARGPLPAVASRTLDRSTLWAMQTPQVMRRASLLAAYAACPVPLDAVTDDAQLLELNGQPVWLVPGDEQNLKITTAIDLRMAEMLLADEARDT